MDTAINLEFYKEKELSLYFFDYIAVIHLFALNGEPMDGVSTLKFLLILKEKLLKIDKMSNKI